MKNILFFTIMLLNIFACKTTKYVSSNKHKYEFKRFSGEVFEKGTKHIQTENNYIFKDTFYRPKNYKIYLIKNPEYDSEKKKIYVSKETKFSIDIPLKLLKKYNFFEFSSNYYRCFVRTDTLYSSQKIIMDAIPVVAYKPAIYLYPETTTKIQIKHIFKGKILNTYPPYNNGWNVEVTPEGRIYNEKDQRHYNYLFWDGENKFPPQHYNFKSGFIVENKNLISFFQDKLSFIGLNETEINDFIVYWVPVLSQKKYNFIYFRINDNIDNTSFLKIDPNPETIIRVFMEFKGYDKLGEIKNVKTQKLEKHTRKGFTVIEWGGSNIESIKFE